MHTTNRAIRRIAQISILTLCVALGHAADRQVPGDYPTIAAAVAAAQPGDRILIHNGIYRENVTSSVPNLQFIGRSAIWDGTLGPGTNEACLDATGDGTVIQGFIFRGGPNGSPMLRITGNDCQISRCTAKGPNANFAHITGNGAEVRNCFMSGIRGTGIEIVGDNAVVTRLKVLNGDSSVLAISGANAVVSRCSLVNVEDTYPIRVTGDNVRLTRNTFLNCESSFSISGDNAIIERNRSRNGGTMNVSGTNFVIRRNSILGTTDDKDGWDLNSGGSEVGGGLFENNRISRVAETGIFVNCNFATLRNNRIERSGTEQNDIAVNITGHGNHLINNVVRLAGKGGYQISGSTNQLEGCVVTRATGDGFAILGDGNTLIRCLANRCDAEGLDNRGQGTTVTGSFFRNNRIDVANDGTFTNAGTFDEDNEFEIGGVNTLPEID